MISPAAITPRTATMSTSAIAVAASLPASPRGGGGGNGARRAKGRRVGRAPPQWARAARASARQANVRARHQRRRTRPKVYGDAAYGSGEFLDHLARSDIDS